jgi:hypothetical protein
MGGLSRYIGGDAAGGLPGLVFGRFLVEVIVKLRSCHLHLF